MKLFLTKRAQRNYDSIKDYIEKEFGKAASEAFTNKADETFRLLEDFPEMGSVEIKNVRGFQLSKQTRVFYRIKNETLIILSLFDVRQNPQRKPR